jgi:hypothetical protein
MRRWFFYLLTLVILIAGAAYFLIPDDQNFSYQTTISCTDDGAMRLLHDKSKWQSWFPGERKDDSTFTYKSFTYRIKKMLFTGVEIILFNESDTITGDLEIISAGSDSANLIWNSSHILPGDPLKRFTGYFRGNKMRGNIESFLGEIKSFFEKEENIYGMKVSEQTVKDPSLVAVKNTFDHYPSIQEIYAMINAIKEYVQKKGGQEKDYPMLNVHTDDSLTYEVMAAIPTTTDLPSEGNFALKKMVLGNILVAEVKGGFGAIINGEQQLAAYVRDHKKSSPAIPYQMLVTNRLLEPDTSKWITRLYYPVFF